MAAQVSPEDLKPRTLELRAPPKAANVAVLGVIPRPGGEWFVAYSVIRLGKNDGPTIAGVCTLGDLPVPQRKRADAWVDQFSHLFGASH
jgi:hypothetical protein